MLTGELQNPQKNNRLPRRIASVLDMAVIPLLAPNTGRPGRIQGPLNYIPSLSPAWAI